MSVEVAAFTVNQTDIQCHPAFDSFENIKDRNILRLACEREAALHTAIGTHDLTFDELLEDLGEKTARDLVFLSDLGHEADLLVGLPRKEENAANTVITFSGELHGITIAKF